MADPTATYVFLPWVRQGAAAGIQTPDNPDNLSGSGPAGIVAVTAGLQVNGAHLVERTVRLYGLGDVTGIDPQQVIRTEPRHLAQEFEPNYFPAIEFDRPDFPWLFTPAKAAADGRLRPWLCLVVVRKQGGGTLRTGPDQLLPVLETNSDELPDLSESWAWAHAQVAGSPLDDEALKSALGGNPALTLSRLLCPRRLDPNTEYLACVVPTFELGCKAGLGLPIKREDEETLKPAWFSGEQPPAPKSLPVYYHWEFRTGIGGDFEALVSRLTPGVMSEEVGKRPINISRPGFAIEPEPPPGTILEFEGALRVRDAEEAEWLEETRKPFQQALAKILNAPWQAMKDGLPDDVEPILGPPIYGCWQADEHIVKVAPESPGAALTAPWLHELNLDPRHRAVAALGTLVVQDQQEQLMAAAWEQLGEIQRINQMQRQAQLARAVNGVFHGKHFANFAPDKLLNVVAPAQSRLVLEAAGPNDRAAPTMLSHAISQSSLPDRAVSAPMRRLTNPRGAISVRFQQIDRAVAVIAKLNTPVTLVPSQRKPAGWVTINQVSDGVDLGIQPAIRFERIAQALDSALQPSDFKLVPEGSAHGLLDFRSGQANQPGAAAFLDAAKTLQLYLDQGAFASSIAAQAPTSKEMDLPALQQELLQSLDPAKTLKARVQASLKLAENALQSDDPLAPLQDSPTFPQPMFEALRDLSQDFLFPGLEHVLPDTVTLLETNGKFVESFLVGLNAEMSREMLWRGFPTSLRSTYFRQFWNATEPDIKAINEWEDKGLGQNAQNNENLVLLIRGELLRRYPNSVIYAVKAVSKQELSRDPAEESHPIFRGTLKPDVTFLGFELSRKKVIGDEATDDPGWFFVIQEQPTEPRFGLDAPVFGTELKLDDWQDLNWAHLAKTEAELKALSHASARTVPQLVKDAAFNDAKWGTNAAHQAFITWQRPVRVAIHASQLIPKDEPKKDEPKKDEPNP